MEIVEHLIKELGVSTKQAEGGAGLLLELAQQRLSPEEFVEVARAIPAISDVIGKAPRRVSRPLGPLRDVLSRWFSSLGGLGVLVPRFEKLGCDKLMIRKFADAVVGFFRDKGGNEIATLLQGALR
jgi:hypothetical protein